MRQSAQLLRKRFNGTVILGRGHSCIIFKLQRKSTDKMSNRAGLQSANSCSGSRGSAFYAASIFQPGKCTP